MDVELNLNLVMNHSAADSALTVLALSFDWPAHQPPNDMASMAWNKRGLRTW